MALERKDVQTPLSVAQLRALVELYRGVPSDNVRTFTIRGRATFVGDASVVLVDDWWAKISVSSSARRTIRRRASSSSRTRRAWADITKTVVGALRGGGWNVATYVNEPTRSTSEIVGSGKTADILATTFGFRHRSGKTTVLRLGLDAQPKSE